MIDSAARSSRSAAQLLTSFIATLAELTPQRQFCVAYSGGLDSHVLLHLMAAWRQQTDIGLRALHVNHGLHPDAALWASHCATVCHDLAVACDLLSVTVDVQGCGVEAAARDARYTALQSQLLPGECLVTAHHQEDQAETVLLQLMRGAGLAGLAAMPQSKPWGDTHMLRPLLGVPHADLVAYATCHGLCWVEDPSNTDTAYDRNYVRQVVMPALCARWPTAAAQIAQSGQYCADAMHQLSPVWRDAQAAAVGQRPNTLSVKKLLLLPRSMRWSVMRAWCLEHAGESPARRHWPELDRAMLGAGRSAQPQFRVGQHVMRRYRDDVYLVPPQRPPIPLTYSVQWDQRAPLVLPGGWGTLHASDVPFDGVVTVRRARPGDRIQLPHWRHASTVKNQVQSQGVPPWEREGVLLLSGGAGCSVVVARLV